MEDLKVAVEVAMGRPGVQWVEHKTAFLLNCGTEYGMKAVLALGNWELRGARLRVSVAEKRMTGPEIFRFVGDRLQAKERAEEYDGKVEEPRGFREKGAQLPKEGYGKGYRGTQPILAVETQPARASSSKASLSAGSPQAPKKEEGKGGWRRERSPVRSSGSPWNRSQSVPVDKNEWRGGKGLGKGATQPWRPNAWWGTLSGRNGSGRGGWAREYWACKDAGYQCDDDFWTCEWWKKANPGREKRWEASRRKLQGLRPKAKDAPGESEKDREASGKGLGVSELQES
jgi:hypothetical protein